MYCQNYEDMVKDFSMASVTNIDTIEENIINHFEVMNDKIEYSSTFTKPLSEILNTTSNIIHATVLVRSTDLTNNASLVFSINHGEENYFWSAFNLKSFIINKGNWNKCYYSIRLPIIKSKDDILKVYVLNNEKKNIQIDDFTIKIEQGNENLYGIRKDKHLFK